MVISFGHSDGQWKSKYSYSPRVMMNSTTSLLSKGEGVPIYKHNEGDINSFYDTVTPSSIGVAFNQNPSSNKIFKSLSVEGSNSLEKRTHLFSAKSSSDMPNESKIARTYFAKNMGGILYNGIEKSDILRNGATMHYVGDVLEIDKYPTDDDPASIGNPDVEGSKYYTSVTVDDSLSDYIPSANVIYAFYIPSEDAFYFGADIIESEDDDEDDTTDEDDDLDPLNDCDVLQYYASTGFFTLTYQGGNLVFNTPVFPSEDPSLITVEALGEVDGIATTITATPSPDGAPVWVMPISSPGTWTVQATASNDGVACDTQFIASYFLSEEQVEPGVLCEDVNNDENYSVTVIQPSAFAPGEPVPQDGAVSVQFLTEIGVPPYTLSLGDYGEGAYPDSYSDSGTIVSASWSNLAAGSYFLNISDSNPSDNYAQNNDGAGGCFSTIDVINLANPANPFACNVFDELASAGTTFSYTPSDGEGLILIPLIAFEGLDDTVDNGTYDASQINVYGIENATGEQVDMSYTGVIGNAHSWEAAIPSGTWTFIASVPSCEDVVYLASNQLIASSGGNCTFLNTASLLAEAFIVQPSYSLESPSTIQLTIPGPDINGGFGVDDFTFVWTDYQALGGADEAITVNDNGQEYPADPNITWSIQGPNSNVNYEHIAITIEGVMPGENQGAYYTWQLYSQPCAAEVQGSFEYGVFLSNGDIRVPATPIEVEEYDWDGAPFDGIESNDAYDGQVTTGSLLSFLTAFGTANLIDGAEFVIDPVYGVANFDGDSDGAVATSDLLMLLTAFGDQDDEYFQQYVPGTDPTDPTLYGASPAQFFQALGGQAVPIPGGLYDPSGGAGERGAKSLENESSTQGLVSFEDLDYASNLPETTIGLSKDQEEIVQFRLKGRPIYNMFNTKPSVQEYLLSLEDKQVQLFAFKDWQTYGDDHRGQTSELTLNLGSKDFELFAVNLNYEMANADHSK